MKTILLRTPLVGVIANKKLEATYRARLRKVEGKQVTIQIGQELDGDISWGSCWYLNTLLKDIVRTKDDYLWLDYGQRWSVEGIGGVLREALHHIITDINHRD